MNARSNFTQAIFIQLLVLLAKIISELFRFYKHLKTQFFAYLLTLLVAQLCFCLIMGLIGLIVGLAIGRAELINREISVGFSRYFL